MSEIDSRISRLVELLLGQTRRDQIAWEFSEDLGSPGSMFVMPPVRHSRETGSVEVRLPGIITVIDSDGRLVATSSIDNEESQELFFLANVSARGAARFVSDLLHDLGAE